MRKVTLASVLLALLAGCSGFALSPTAETETVTPAPVPTPATDQPTRGAVAPGVDSGGVTDSGRLAQAHTNATENRSYRWTERSSLTRLESNSTETTRTVLLVQRERRYRYEFSTTLVPENTSEYTQGDTRYRREFGDYNYVKEPSVSATERYGEEPKTAIRRYLSTGTVIVELARVDGQRYYRLTGTTSPIETAGRVSNYSVHALVRPSGFVQSLSVSYDRTTDETRHRVTYRYRYTDVGATEVDLPTWVEQRWPDAVDARAMTSSAP